MAYLYWVHLPEHKDMFSEGYVGITTRTVKTRWNSHKTAAKIRNKQHLPIYRAINKYGEQGLVVTTLVEASEEYVSDLEIKLRPTEGIGWNCAMGGQDTGRGRTHSPEEKAKRAASITGLKRSAETRQKQSAASKGRPKSEKHKRKIRANLTGRKQSSETIEKRRLAMLVVGRKITPDGRKRLSESNKALAPWNRSRSDFRVWGRAQEIAHIASSGEKFSTRHLANRFGLKDSKFSKIVEMIRSGWNPSQDAAYLSWLAEYKPTTKGALNA